MYRLTRDRLTTLFAGPPDIDRLRERHDVVGLVAALGHPLPWVRRNAAEVLGNMHEQQAHKLLTAALNDSDAEVRAAAHTALTQLNDPSGGAPEARRR